MARGYNPCMLADDRLRMSEADYLRFDLEHADGKHEYVNGEVIAMAGAHPAHTFLTSQLVIALGTRLRGRPCSVHASDLRVKVSETGMYAYPDLVVICGTPRFAPTNPPTLLNPKLVVEVLSPSTSEYDRGAKFAHYQRLSEVQEYLLVGCPDRRVEHYRRLATGQWLLTVVEGEGVLELPTFELSVPLDELYTGIEAFVEPPPAS